MPSESSEAPLAPGDVVVVPFPFTERATSKRRPALVLSGPEFTANTDHVILTMITSARQSSWSSDVPITEGALTGLQAVSMVRWKLFTLHRALILKKVGVLSPRDLSACARALPVAIPS